MLIEDEQLDRLAMIWLVTENNPQLRKQIEEQLIELSKTNERFQREYFYAYFTVPARVVGIRFLPGTESYLEYGNYIVVTPTFHDDEVRVIVENIKAERPTYGLVTATDINQILSIEKRTRLLNTGFDTRHVIEIQSL